MNIALGTYDHQLSFFTDNSKGLSREDYEGFLDSETFEDVDRHSRVEYSFLLEEIEFLCLTWNPMEHPNPILVINNCGQCDRILTLSKLFPTLEIHAWGYGGSVLSKVQNVVVHTQAITESESLSFYSPTAKRKILFVNNLDFSSFDTDESYSLEFWNDFQNAQQALLENMKPVASLLSVGIPIFVGQDYPNQARLIKSFVRPKCLSSYYSDLSDKTLRFMVIEKKRTVTNYSYEWMEKTLNYWNLSAKRGRIMSNSVDESSVIEVEDKTYYCGIEMCRILVILKRYLDFNRRESEMKDILGLVTIIESSLKEKDVVYSLAEHTARYAEAIQTLDQPNLDAASLPLTLQKAKMLLQSSHTIDDLTL